MPPLPSLPRQPLWLVSAVGALLAAVLAGPLTSQTTAPTERQILEAEHARFDASVLIAAAQSRDPRLQRLGLRAIGRFERPDLAPLVQSLLRAPDARVRMEAVNALGQMNAPFAYASLLAGERDAAVRGTIYETIGRVRTAPADAEATLARGLAEPEMASRAGAARGLESFARRTARTTRLTDATLAAARRVARSRDAGALAEEMRENALLALSAASDRDSATIAVALGDPSAQVRRVAVTMARRWMNDPSYIVRWAALRYAGDCARFTAATADENEHVRLLAIDSLGGRECDLSTLITLSDRPGAWRMQAHALVALAKRSPASARARLPFLAASPLPQARAYAAQAARIVGDTALLGRLAHDANPNVVAAALTFPADARRAFANAHAGVVVEAVDFVLRLKRDGQLTADDEASLVAPALESLDRFTRLAAERVTLRDPRIKLLEFLKPQRDNGQTSLRLRPLLSDPDPVVAAAAASVITAMTGSTTTPITTTYKPAPLPSDGYIRALRGAKARLTVKGLGPIELELLTDDATVTTAIFAELAERGRYDGLTFHRIVPNFVVQGGSPGADEYDALTPAFMRDEVGLARNARGTFGISTRGRDTGDGQLYINLIDNYRLDHDYTVFGRVVSGLPLIDRIGEGDVIESIRIIRAPGAR